MTKYVIWDFNGTILDDLDLCLNLLNEMLSSQHKKTLNKDEYKAVFGFPIEAYYRKAGLSFEHESFDKLAHFFIEKYQPASMQCSIHDGVIETLKMLKQKGIHSIILSASESKNLLEQLKHLNIESYFDSAIGTDNIKGLGKIDSGIAFMKKHLVNPNECLYVGDTFHDYEVAKALNVKVVLYSGGHQNEAQLKVSNVPIIQNIKEIMNYL